jgi:hypothetical protein
LSPPSRPAGFLGWRRVPGLTAVLATLAPPAAAAAQSTRCSFRGCRELREGGDRGSRAGALSGQQPNCPAAGAEEDCGGSAVAARVPGDAAPPAQGLWARKPRSRLWAAPGRIIFRASISLPPVVDIFGNCLDFGLVGGWDSGRGGVAGRVAAPGVGFPGFLAGAFGLK